MDINASLEHIKSIQMLCDLSVPEEVVVFVHY